MQSRNKLVELKLSTQPIIYHHWNSSTLIIFGWLKGFTLIHMTQLGIHLTCRKTPWTKLGHQGHCGSASQQPGGTTCSWKVTPAWGKQTSVGKLGSLFSHLGVPWCAWNLGQKWFLLHGRNDEATEQSRVIFTESCLRQGLQKACTRLSKGHGNFATTWCTSSWLNYLVSRLPFKHLVQLGFKGVSHTISKKWGTLRSSRWAHDSTISGGWNMLDKSEHWTLLNHFMGPGALWSHTLSNMFTNMFMICLATTYCMRILQVIGTSISLVFFWGKMTGHGIESRVVCRHGIAMT